MIAVTLYVGTVLMALGRNKTMEKGSFNYLPNSLYNCKKERHLCSVDAFAVHSYSNTVSFP